MQKDQIELQWAILLSCLFVLFLMVAAVLLYRIYLKRKNKLLVEREILQTRFDRALLQSKLEIQEQTFRDIGKELHDNIGQVLSLVRLNLNTLTVSEGADKVNAMDALLDKALVDLRNLSHSLDTDLIRKNGWAEATSRLLQNLKNTGKYTVHTAFEIDLPAVNPEKGIILFRMVQEAIQNILKHAKAKTITLTARTEKDQVEVSIQDDGRGFDPSATGGGAGLDNIRSRARMIGARLSIDSRPGFGTIVIILLKPDSLG